MRITSPQQRRRSVQLATRILDAVERNRSRFVLLTSVAEGEGKTELSDAIRLGLTIAGYEHFRVIHWRDLARIEPHQFPADMLVFIDGPAMLEGADVLSIPASWRGAIDGSVLVVMKRITRRQEVEEAVEWLRAAGYPVIGAVWNDFRFPSLRALIEGLRARVQPPTRGDITANLPWGEMARRTMQAQADAYEARQADTTGVVAAGRLPTTSAPPMPPPSSNPPPPFDDRRSAPRVAVTSTPDASAIPLGDADVRVVTQSSNTPPTVPPEEP